MSQPAKKAPSVRSPKTSKSATDGPPKGGDSEGSGNTGNAKQPRRTKRPGHGGIKVRVKLPPIESYQKEVEFRAEGPGRVIVRLERLMGSDRVRLTDPKYMAQLLERLEEEENNAWKLRTRRRKKEEKNRSRQLAIEGLMEPTDDMQDLYEHPVFRVNRVLKKLALYDQTMSIGQILNLPPIIPVEPFEDDETGAIFKTYPRHTVIHFDDEPKKRPKPKATDADIVIGPSEFSKIAFSKLALEKETDQDDMSVEKEEEGADEGRGQIGGDEEETATTAEGSKSTIVSKVSSMDTSLTAIQKKYGIPSDEDLTKWEGFRANLVDLLYVDEETSVPELYEAAEQIIGVYERESLTADEFVSKKLNKLLGAGGGNTMST